MAHTTRLAALLVLVLLVGCDWERSERKHNAVVECMKARPADSDAFYNCRVIVCGLGGC